jgi:hypothetical protein
MSPLPAPGATNSPPNANSVGEPAILVRRSGGLAGAAEQWTVYPDGRVVDVKGDERMAGSSEVSAGLKAIDRLGFFNLQDSYGVQSQCRDCFVYEIMVNNGSRSKAVKFTEGVSDTPVALTQAMAVIKQLTGATQ